MTTLFNMQRDIGGSATFAPTFTDLNVNLILTANIAIKVFIPVSTDATYRNWTIVFSPSVGNDFWVALNTTAILPSNTISFTSTQQNPQTRYVNVTNTSGGNYNGNQFLSIITNEDNVELGISFYATN